MGGRIYRLKTVSTKEKKKTKRLETKLEQFSGVTGYFVPRIKLTVVINTSSFVFFDRNIWIRHSC